MTVKLTSQSRGWAESSLDRLRAIPQGNRSEAQKAEMQYWSARLRGRAPDPAWGFPSGWLGPFVKLEAVPC